MKMMRFPLGGSFSAFAALIATGFVFTSQADVLVSEGFQTGSDSGFYSLTDKTSLSSNEGGTYTQSKGFTTNKWQSTTGVVVSRTGGLSFPTSIARSMVTAGAGAIGFRGESSAVNWSGSNVAQNNLYRNQHRKLVALNGKSGEKRYFRALMYADSTALSQLSTADTWLSWRNSYSVGIVTMTTDANYYDSVMNCSRYIHISFYRSGASSYEMAYVVKGSEGTAKRMKLCNVTPGHTYLVVAEATLAEGADAFRAFAYDATSDSGLNVDNLPWVDADSSASYTLFDNNSNLSLFVGGQYMTTGTVTFDEICIGTDLRDVIPVADSYVLVGSPSHANITPTSAEVSVTIGMKGVASATPSVAWGTAADALVNSATLNPITEAGCVTNSLTGLDPMTTYYYQWTVTASGADPATSQVASFKTKGEVVFGDVTAGGLPSEGGVWASVDVVETGIGATTVTCLCGETAENMTAIGTWQNVQAGDTLVATNSAAAWGKTYFFKFKSSFEYGNQTYESETPSASQQAAATDHLKTTASGDWTDGANWSLGTPPNDILPATISNVTTMASLYLEDKDVTVKSLRVKNGQAAVDLRGASSMTIGSITFGDKNIMNCDNGVLVTTGGVVTVNGNVAPEWGARTSNNKLEINGTRMTINGELSTVTLNDSGFYNDVLVKNESVLTITNGLVVSYDGKMTVDASVVTNKSDLRVGNWAKAGTLTLKNGSYFRQPYSKTVGAGGKGAGTINVLGGSTFDASGAAFYLGVEGDIGWQDSTLFVSNSAFKAASFAAPRYAFSGAYTIKVEGEDSLFQTTSGMSLGVRTRTAGTASLNVKGGTVKVGGTLALGAGDNDSSMNYLTVSESTAKLELGTLNCRTNATVKFVVPERGFENAVIISATNKVYLAEGMPPIKIDATACKGCKWTSLFEAEKGITNVTAENLASRVVFVETNGHKSYGDRPCDLRLVVDSSGDTPVVKKLQFRVQIGGLSIIVR